MSMKRSVRLMFAMSFAAATVLASYAQQPGSASAQSGNGPAGGYDNLQILANRLLEHPGDADCPKHKCKLLVLDFVTADNRSTVYGRKLADQLAQELAEQDRKIEVMDRAQLHSYLERERITLTQDDGLSRAVGADLNATTVLLCSLGRVDDNSMEASGRMLSVVNKDHTGNREHVDLLAPVSQVDLSPVEVAPLPPYQQTANGEAVYRAGAKGVSLPRCTYTPNPSYSDAARKARLNGLIMAEAIISAEGTLEEVRILRGLPGGLNENALRALKTWRCTPSAKDGRPVAVTVPLEVNFRLY